MAWCHKAIIWSNVDQSGTKPKLGVKILANNLVLYQTVDPATKHCELMWPVRIANIFNRPLTLLDNTKQMCVHVNSFMPKICNSSALAMELCLICIKPSIWNTRTSMSIAYSLNIIPYIYTYILFLINWLKSLVYLSSHDAIPTVEVIVIHVHRTSFALGAASLTTCQW